jgi:prophage antirepressor-like protein
MSALVKVFEGKQIRVQSDDDGALWFVAKDVCEAIGLDNVTQAIANHVESLDLTKREVVQADGFVQKQNCVNEAGLYSLVFGSRLDNAKRFKRWVTSEVLPAIRKTGAYAVPANDNQSSPYDIAGRWLLRAGVDVGIAAACVMSQLEANTGTNMDALRKALPSTTGPVATLNATEVGKLLEISAKAANAALSAAGLQEKSGKDWALTEAGKAHGSAFPYERNGHTSYQVRWLPSVVEVLRG